MAQIVFEHLQMADRDQQSQKPGPQLKNSDNPTLTAAAEQREALTVLTDPHASEQDWLSACDELNKTSPCTKISKNSQNANKLRMVAVLAALFFAVAGGVGYMKFAGVGPFKEATKEVDFGPYMAALQKQIKANWHPPDVHKDSIIQMHFKVHRNGELSDIGFDRMSRLSETDAAALKAVIEAMPALPPLPDGAPDNVDIGFTFEYNDERKK